MALYNSPIYQLSQDIIDHIIDTLLHSLVFEHESQNVEESYAWHEQWELLNTCSLVNRAFLPQSRAHMFRKVVLTVQHEYQRINLHQKCKTLYKILKNNPAIAECVQEVEICLAQGLEASWLYRDEAFVGVMRVLARAKSPLQKFSYWNVPYYRVLSEAEHFFNRVAVHYIVPTITSLYLKDISTLPIDMIGRCVNLSELTLEGVDFGRRVLFTTAPITQPRLKKLDYHRSHKGMQKILGICQGLSAALNMSGLQVLTISANYLEDLQCAQKVLDASQSLENLSLSYISGDSEDDIIPPLTGHINLTACDYLQTLDLPVIFGEKNFPEAPLAYILDILKTIPTANHLKKLTLSLFVRFYGKAAAESSLDADWESFALELRRISTGKPLFLSVRVLYTDLEGLPHSLARYEHIQAVYASLLEKLVRRRMTIFQNDPSITVMTDQMVQPSSSILCYAL